MVVGGSQFEQLQFADCTDSVCQSNISYQDRLPFATCLLLVLRKKSQEQLNFFSILLTLYVALPIGPSGKAINVCLIWAHENLTTTVMWFSPTWNWNGSKFISVTDIFWFHSKYTCIRHLLQYIEGKLGSSIFWVGGRNVIIILIYPDKPFQSP